MRAPQIQPKKLVLGCCAGCCAQKAKSRNTRQVRKKVFRSKSSSKLPKNGEDRTAEILAPVLGVSKEKVKKVVEHLRQPEFEAFVLRSNSGTRVPTSDQLRKAQLRVLRFLGCPIAREVVAQAFLLATKEEGLVFDFEKSMRRVAGAKLTQGYRKDFKDSMALTVDDSRKSYPIYLDMLFPLTTEAMVSLLLHESLHWCARRNRAGNPRISQDLEHAAMMILGDKDISNAS